MDPLTLDALDRQLVHALQVDGRVGFGRLAEVLGASDRTLNRRYRRLVAAGVLRVVGVPVARALGRADWLVRMRCLPHAAQEIGAALAAEPDMSWVTLLSGGAEIACMVRAPADALVLRSLPRSSRIGPVSAQRLLRPVAGADGWPGRLRALSADQVRALRETGPGEPGPEDRPMFGDEDRRLLPILAMDGRASWSALARATGWSPAAVARRVEQLRRSGALVLEVDVEPALFGAPLGAMLWLTVRPSALADAGRALAAHPDIAFAAVTTGSTNLVAFVVCSGDEALYDDVLLPLGRVDGVDHVDLTPIAEAVSRSAATGRPRGR
ncbi:Lrp/AsnC family transcriptional regulator [Pseudonocardia phyllosphaerae]|uniref:Lrp/AsnC family transcriptional regulator n=1 Tax=Pseudonocardia phyllosphaerae TaxID=3390502 RepID=UPI00397D17BE